MDGWVDGCTDCMAGHALVSLFFDGESRAVLRSERYTVENVSCCAAEISCAVRVRTIAKSKCDRFVPVIVPVATTRPNMLALKTRNDPRKSIASGRWSGFSHVNDFESWSLLLRLAHLVRLPPCLPECKYVSRPLRTASI